MSMGRYQPLAQRLALVASGSDAHAMVLASSLARKLEAWGCTAHVVEARHLAAWLAGGHLEPGGLDFLVYDARGLLLGEAEALAVALSSLTGLARQARQLMAGRDGRLIIVSPATAGLACGPNQPALAAAAVALESIARSLAVELASSRILVNCVRAGLAIAASDPPALEAQPALADPVADAVALLCLAEAGWICGQTVSLERGASWR
jgi:NAD(P)-dependent dehydrogenase (short-subunit alcohol dehydrogenase family)